MTSAELKKQTSKKLIPSLFQMAPPLTSVRSSVAFLPRKPCLKDLSHPVSELMQLLNIYHIFYLKEIISRHLENLALTCTWLDNIGLPLTCHLRFLTCYMWVPQKFSVYDFIQFISRRFCTKTTSSIFVKVWWTCIQHQIEMKVIWYLQTIYIYLYVYLKSTSH